MKESIDGLMNELSTHVWKVTSGSSTTIVAFYPNLPNHQEL